MIIVKNISTIFMVKSLGIDRDKLERNGFVNGYCGDAGQDFHYEDCVYLLFKPTDMDRFAFFLDQEKERTDVIVDDYDYEGGYVVVVYQLDPEFKPDFDLIRQGQYSKTSRRFQELFPKVTKIVKNGKYRDEISLQYRIFNKTQDLVAFWEEKLGVRFSPDQEVWEGFHEERETLNIHKLKLDEIIN
jgi:hypothetical protein